MAFLEITDKKVWSLFRETVEDTYDDDMAERLMKFTLKTVKQWDDYAVSPKTLKSMRNHCNKILKIMGEE